MRARAAESSKLPNSPAWHALYRAALFENDPHKMSDRILKAQGVLIQRARELCTGSKDTFQERQAIEDALYILRSVLRDRLESKHPRINRL